MGLKGWTNMTSEFRLTKPRSEYYITQQNLVVTEQYMVSQTNGPTDKLTDKVYLDILENDQESHLSIFDLQVYTLTFRCIAKLTVMYQMMQESKRKKNCCILK